MKCWLCDGTAVATRYGTVARAGGGGEREEIIGYCATHVVGQHLDGMAYPVDHRRGKDRRAPFLIADCEACGSRFATDGIKTVCRACFYDGATHARRPRMAALIERLNEAAPTAEVEIWHTGGGCFGLAVKWENGRFLFGTVAVMDEQTEEWTADAVLPNDDERWGIGVYAGEDEWGAGAAERWIVPATDDDFVRVATEEAR